MFDNLFNSPKRVVKPKRYSTTPRMSKGYVAVNQSNNGYTVTVWTDRAGFYTKTNILSKREAEATAKRLAKLNNVKYVGFN